MPTITPHLWYDNEAHEAAKLYCSIFPGSRIHGDHVFENSGPDGTQTVTTVTFEVCGQRVIALNGGPHQEFNDRFSFMVECDTQEEVDEYWAKLTADGGQEIQCGWLKDRFGLAWQIVPKLLGELLGDEDPVRATAVMHAMLGMKKIDCDGLRAAYNEPASVPAPGSVSS